MPFTAAAAAEGKGEGPGTRAGEGRGAGGQLPGPQGPDALRLFGWRGQGVSPPRPGTPAALRGSGGRADRAASQPRPEQPWLFATPSGGRTGGGKEGRHPAARRSPGRRGGGGPSAGRARGQARRERGGPRAGAAAQQGRGLPPRGGGCPRSRLYNAGAARPSAPRRPGCGRRLRAAPLPPLRPGDAPGLGKGGEIHQAERQGAEAGRRHSSSPPEPAAP